ncbi:LuxR C-terminal-related transcriptional regulator [Streptomyces sp. NPDC001985]|uniref:response regulator transcription factor n=1 Tax=Streptomyces sp. NPDC001985 TaxID=3154406 RepID=UPI00332925C9
MVAERTAAGLSNTEVSGRLFISVATVKACMTRPPARLGARDRAQLVFIAQERGLVSPGG